jgi:hypothetical protein
MNDIEPEGMVREQDKRLPSREVHARSRNLYAARYELHPGFYDWSQNIEANV